MRRTINESVFQQTTTAGGTNMNRSSTIMIIPDENFYNRDPLSKTGSIKIRNKFIAPNPEDYFDDASV
jgi:hypothetical protein